MTDFYTCLGSVAPYYNLVLVLIVVILLLYLFRRNDKKTYIKPWNLLFFAICIYIVEEVLAILDLSKAISLHPAIFPFLETIIVTSFIYMVLIQKEYVKNEKITKK